MGLILKNLKQLKSRIWWYRRRVPADIQDCIGKKEYKRSLDTKDEATAIKRWAVLNEAVDSLFADCRKSKVRRVPLSAKSLSILADNFSAERLDLDEQQRPKGYEGLHWLDRFPYLEPEDITPTLTAMDAVNNQAAKAHFELQGLKMALATEDFDNLETGLKTRIAHHLKREGHTKAPSPTDYKLFVQAEIKALEGVLSRSEGETVPTPVIKPVGSFLLSVEAEKWKNDKLRLEEWGTATANAFIASIKLFCKIISDKDISEYRKDDAREYKRILLKYPKNAWQYSEFEHMTVKQILKVGKEPMSINNARKIFQLTGSFFKHALQSYDVMQTNPFAGQGIRKQSNDNSRDPFSIEDLTKIFSSSIYKGGVRSYRFWKKAGNMSMRHTARFWVPLISLYTGMRLGEICQLHKDDIRQENGVWIFDIQRGDDKTFKTGAAIRQIPVHSELIKCGLLEHVEKCDSVRLFPDAKKAKDGTYSGNFSKWYNAQYLVSVGVKRPKIVFHSYRHLFEDAAMNTGMNDSMVDMLQGHKLEGMKSVYALNLDLKLKDSFVQKIKYEGLDLSHIYVMPTM